MNTRTRRSLVVVSALVATAGLAACSGSDSDTDASASTTTAATPAASATSVDPLMADLVGPGCAAYATQVPTGSGSVSGMSEDPLATAASNNPLLTQLTAAVSGKLNKKVNLVDTLNGGDYTVFAPVDAAFEKVPAATLKKLKTDSTLLVKVLTYHVVAGQIAPSDIVGTHKSVEGGDVKVTGSGSTLKVNDANVICGGVKTANATVYLIDGVLSPPS